MKARTTETVSKPFEFSTRDLETFGATVGEAAERSKEIVANGLKTWESEVGRYFEQFAAHSEATLKALANCKGPMDVLAVEQEWLKSRTQAYLDSGMRFAKAFAEVANAAKAQAPAAPQPGSAPDTHTTAN